MQRWMIGPALRPAMQVEVCYEVTHSHKTHTRLPGVQSVLQHPLLQESKWESHVEFHADCG